MTEPSHTVEITVGKVGRAHGLRGDVFVDVRTDDPERRFAAGTAFPTPRGDLVVVSARWHGNRLLVRFEQMHDREDAERLQVPRDERPEDPEEFYDHQLRELSAYTSEGSLIGKVSDVLHLPGQDTLVLDVDGREVLVPFVDEIVPEVDLAGGRVTIVDRPGLLAEEERAPDPGQNGE